MCRRCPRSRTAPLILLVSARTESLILMDAPDFRTWCAATYVVPSLRELESLARERGVLQAMPMPERRPVAPARPPIRFLHLSDLHLRHRDARRLDATGVPAEHLFVVPGNHDVDRSAGRWLLRTLESDEEATAFFVSEGHRRWHAEKLAAYRQAMSALLGAERGLGLRCGAEAVEFVNIRGASIAVASFNSAWFAQDDEDQSKLWLGEANVDHAGQRIREAGVALAVALMHHPLDHQAEAERPHIEAHLERTFDLILRGHLHTHKSRALRSLRGGYLELAAPPRIRGASGRTDASWATSTSTPGASS